MGGTRREEEKRREGAGRGSGPRPWMPAGRRSSRSGPRGPARSCPSGSERDPARRPEMLPHLRERRRVERKLLPRRKRRKRRKRRRRRRRRSKLSPLRQPLISLTFQKHKRKYAKIERKNMKQTE